ncbi:ShlB/FhaC/HecB family hemolysin secretion/activation protein [Hydrogenophaga sp. BPS33]|uniref:ShlB/FhaC/HecB family hemolysin secretion/activation protein n=1 Tax=Hydrogenophaga sp. BPS33 TaxID=2651974 RepID=UPI00135930D1|nr:ShlB/FhaC/HecB family hemolysin secretion/activation protein [Hydrogenophaga sp. BPS33]
MHIDKNREFIQGPIAAWAIGFAALVSLGAVQAQPAGPTPQQIDQIRQQQEQLQREEQQRREALLREQDAARRLPGTVDVPAPAAPPEPADDGQCFNVERIELDGALHLSAAEQASLTASFIGRCVGLKGIRELMRAITNHYVDIGLVTTRVYIPQQDMGQGLLKLLVLEGKVGSVRLSDEQAGVDLASAFPGLQGRVLNIRDIEQGLDQINRLGSNNATMSLEPSNEPGLTNVLIQNRPRERVNAGLTVDNYGSPSTGDLRGTVNLSVDNLYGVNDAWFASFSRNLDAHPRTRLSESFMIGANYPYGYWNFSANISKSAYASTVRSFTQQFRSSGNTETFSIGAQRVLLRGQTSKLTLNTGLAHKDSRNYIEGSLLTASSPKLTDFSLGLTSVFAVGAGTFTVDTSLNKGLKAFGVQALPGAGMNNVPTPTGVRYNAGISYFRPLRLGSLDATWSSSLQMQTSPHVLYGSEQMSVGGMHTVRGFDGTSASGERGAYWRNDLAVTFAPAADPVTAKWFGRLQTYVAIDTGRIYGREGQFTGSLAGMVVGMRTVGGKIGLDIGYGEPLRASTSIQARGEIEGYALYARASIAF